MKIESSWAVLAVGMSLRQYFKAKDGLPEPNGSLSRVMTTKAIAFANKEVEKALNDQTPKKRGPYKR